MEKRKKNAQKEDKMRFFTKLGGNIYFRSELKEKKSILTRQSY